MLFHVASIPSPVDMVVRSADTDILVIALECLSTIDPHKKNYGWKLGWREKTLYVILTIKSIKLLVSKYAEDYLHYMLLQALTT